MNRKGFTLLELVIVLVISSLLVLAIAYEFMVLSSYQKAVLDQINASNDARTAMDDMVRVLRYAIAPVTVAANSGGYATNITATIAGPGHLNEITSNTEVTFGRTADNTFVYNIGSTAGVGGATYAIVNNITDLAAEWDSANNELTLWLTATAAGSGKTSSLESKVHLLGE